VAGQELSFGDHEFIVSKTDTKGNITYGNGVFIRMSGYTEEELINAPHKILRHPKMPAFIFKFLWQRVRAGKEIFAYVVNRNKNDDYYWVFAHVTASRDESGRIIGYHSARRKPKAKALEIIKPLYETLLRAEKSGGVSASEAKLQALLDEKGVSYDEFILSL